MFLILLYKTLTWKKYDTGTNSRMRIGEKKEGDIEM